MRACSHQVLMSNRISMEECAVMLALPSLEVRSINVELQREVRVLLDPRLKRVRIGVGRAGNAGLPRVHSLCQKNSTTASCSLLSPAHQSELPVNEENVATSILASNCPSLITSLCSRSAGPRCFAFTGCSQGSVIVAAVDTVSVRLASVRGG